MSTYVRKGYNGTIVATIYEGVVYSGKDAVVSGSPLTNAAGDKIYSGKGRSQIGYVSAQGVYTYGGTLVASIRGSMVESVERGNVHIDGSATDGEKGAGWMAACYI